MHGQNSTHKTKQCRTLKKEAEKLKKGRKNGGRENGMKKREYNPSKEEIHALVAFAKDAMAKEYKNVNKELKNFKNMSESGDEAKE